MGPLRWDMRRQVDHDAMPVGRSVIKFEFSDVPARAHRWWLVVTPRDADVCDVDPGYPVTVSVHTTLRGMTDIWLGNVTWARARRSDTFAVRGPGELCREMTRWFTLSGSASAPRP